MKRPKFIKSKIMIEVYDWLSSIIIAFALALFINIFLFQPTEVMGTSMLPTLQDHNYIFISKLSHTFRSLPNYDDIVIIDHRVERERSWKDDVTEPLLVYWAAISRSPEQEHDVWVKRVIGHPGDTLEFKDGKVLRNGRVLDEPYINGPMDTEQWEGKKIVVPENNIFVMGDNRNHSMDSRIIGSVPIDHVLGHMVFLWKHQ